MSKQIKVTWQETELVTTEFTQILTVGDDLDWSGPISREASVFIEDAICDQAQYEVGLNGAQLYTNGEFIDSDTQDRNIVEVKEVK